MKRNIFIILSVLSVLFAIAFAVLTFKFPNTVSFAVASAALFCVPFFLYYEKTKENSRVTVIVAVMTALAVVGRFVFAQIPGFKPVTAVTVITGVYLGPHAGFITGALAALISNIYFGQGPWTLFEMLAWGLTGFLAAILNKNGFLEKRIPLLIYGAFAGLLYSLIMDIYTVLSFTGSFSIEKYVAAIVSSSWFTGNYTVSNVVFLLLLMNPAGRIFKRIKKKYGLS